VDRSVNDNFKFNQETEFVPVLGLIASQLSSSPNGLANPDADFTTASNIQENHHPALLSLLADELSVASEKIHDFEL
jgi:aspartyl aminopeptidase